MLDTKPFVKFVLPYASALALVFSVYALKTLFEPYVDSHSHFVLFALPIFLSAWLGGKGPGFFAIIISAAIIHFGLLAPNSSKGLVGSKEILPLILLVIEGSILTLVTDRLKVTERKFRAALARETEGRKILESAIQAARMATWSWDFASDEIIWKEGTQFLFGESELERFQTCEDYLKFAHVDDVAKLKDALTQAVRTSTGFSLEYRMQRLDGSLLWVSDHGRVVSQNGKPIRMDGVVFDITDRKAAEDDALRSASHVRSLNRRLQLAMTETHHRVKNSLQLISSLLSLTAKRKEPISREELYDLTSQVQSFSVLHDILTDRSEADNDLKEISARAVVEKLAPLLKQTIASKALSFHLDDGEVTCRQAASLGVIVNELVSNAIKHGETSIEVFLSRSGEGLNLRVQNDGVGFPENFTTNEMSTGLRLVEELSISDFGRYPLYQTTVDGKAEVSIEIPLPKKGSELASQLT